MDLTNEAPAATAATCAYCGDETSPVAWTTCGDCGKIFCGVECYRDHLEDPDFQEY